MFMALDSELWANDVKQIYYVVWQNNSYICCTTKLFLIYKHQQLEIVHDRLLGLNKVFANVIILYLLVAK